ncbi:HAD-like domain-containing protein [Pseudomassariella vexata]|uniref:HAD-like domain-containing protein n=1 Tax=Pseudomassariella vexata TaxID=1141098 RepID=A0A1Y2EI58_9PEZI|nr:HAD-like domain-containing protein [Pseudomassariella vexata]ORY71258.1 HAD-like domain-containing protein [Pseudomassariella vexata]
MPPIRAIFFDFMGTCLDWHTTVVSSLPSSIPAETRSKLALVWREAFFAENHARQALSLPSEDIDLTHRRTLLRLLDAEPWATACKPLFGKEKEETVARAVESWHQMQAWPDVSPGMATLKKVVSSPGTGTETPIELFVLANGTTRLQLDLVRSSGLGRNGIFSMLFSSELLGVYKPAPEAYVKALGLVGVQAEESVMVAAHAYDLRAARKVGMRTVYVRRWTDDTDEYMQVVRGENKAFLEGMGRLRGVVEGFTRE